MPRSISWIGTSLKAAATRRFHRSFPRNLTYAELSNAAARSSVPFWRAFVSNRKTVSPLCCSIQSRFPILFRGAVRAGVVPVLLNTRLTADQYRYLLEDSRAKAVFVLTALLPVIEEAAFGSASLQAIVVVGGGPTSMPRLDRLLAAEDELAAQPKPARQYSLLALLVRHHQNAEGRHARAFEPEGDGKECWPAPHRISRR